MTAREFAALVAAVAEGMDQRPDAVKSTPDALLLRTTDGFLFAFVEDVDRLSLAAVERLLADPVARGGRLLVLSPGRIPLALAGRITAMGGAVVDHERFRELLRGLDLGALLGEEPRGPHDRPGGRLLPSARHLDAIVARARTWFEWGVPQLALRFYRQALALKPGFVPAEVGVGRCLAAIGLEDEAMATFRSILSEHAGDPEARLGEAAVHAAAHRPAEEIRVYREVLADHPERLDVRAQLVAAEVDGGRWPEARREIEAMLVGLPEDPRIRFLHAIALARTGEPEAGDRELVRARNLGLPEDEERALRGHLGLPDEPRPPVRAGRAPRSTDAPGTAAPKRRSPPATAESGRRRRPRKGK